MLRIPRAVFRILIPRAVFRTRPADIRVWCLFLVSFFDLVSFFVFLCILEIFTRLFDC